jgi:hypothetical protein
LLPLNRLLCILRSRIDPDTACRRKQDDNAEEQKEEREHGDLLDSCSPIGVPS